MFKTIVFWALFLSLTCSAYLLSNLKNTQINVIAPIETKVSLHSSITSKYQGYCTLNSGILVVNNNDLYYENNQNAVIQITLIKQNSFFTWNKNDTIGIKIEIPNARNKLREKITYQIDKTLEPIQNQQVNCNQNTNYTFLEIPKEVNFIDITGFIKP